PHLHEETIGGAGPSPGQRRQAAALGDGRVVGGNVRWKQAQALDLRRSSGQREQTYGRDRDRPETREEHVTFGIPRTIALFREVKGVAPGVHPLAEALGIIEVLRGPNPRELDERERSVFRAI
ncbi:MAG: hypothetical protein H0U16_11905, partial [Actinobacteria bacterium]|nr:hypothetical protein [Actinomycetota bacterium]